MMAWAVVIVDIVVASITVVAVAVEVVYKIEWIIMPRTSAGAATTADTNAITIALLECNAIGTGSSAIAAAFFLPLPDPNADYLGLILRRDFPLCGSPALA